MYIFCHFSFSVIDLPVCAEVDGWPWMCKFLVQGTSMSVTDKWLLANFNDEKVGFLVWFGFAMAPLKMWELPVIYRPNGRDEALIILPDLTSHE